MFEPYLDAMKDLRLKPGLPVRALYRVVPDPKGNVRSVLRIVWQGDPSGWIGGDGFFAHAGTGWGWTPEDFSKTRGLAWRVSGLGGADDDSEPISKDDALTLLLERGGSPDSLDFGSYPTEEEFRAFAERSRSLAEWVLSRLNAERGVSRSTAHPEDVESPGQFGGRHYATYFEEVKQLKRQGSLDEAESLLLHLLDAVEAEATYQGHGVTPWYYEQLAIVRRKKGDLRGEIEVLERYEGQRKAPGTYPRKLQERLLKARRKLDEASKRQFGRSTQSPTEPVGWTREEWITRLQEHVADARATAPIPDRSSLSIEDEHRCRRNGGLLLAWLNRHGPQILAQRRFFRGPDDRPVIVFTTDITGLVAAREILEGESLELVYLLDTEYDQWMSNNNDDFAYHVHLWARFTEPTGDFLERARREYPQPPGHIYWNHSEGTVWGHLQGRGAEHLWAWNGREPSLLKEAFVEWVT
jgi:hypothetical protein